jgi:hypothetical protein
MDNNMNNNMDNMDNMDNNLSFNDLIYGNYTSYETGDEEYYLDIPELVNLSNLHINNDDDTNSLSHLPRVNSCTFIPIENDTKNKCKRCASEPINMYKSKKYKNDADNNADNDETNIYNNLILQNNEHLFSDDELLLSKEQQIEILEIFCSDFKKNDIHNNEIQNDTSITNCPVIFCKCNSI